MIKEGVMNKCRDNVNRNKAKRFHKVFKKRPCESI